MAALLVATLIILITTHADALRRRVWTRVTVFVAAGTHHSVTLKLGGMHAFDCEMPKERRSSLGKSKSTDQSSLIGR